MVALTLRSVKGSALTHAEVDENFTNLQAALKGNAVQAFSTQQMEVTASSSPVDVTDLVATINLSSPSSKVLVLMSVFADKGLTLNGYLYLLRGGVQIGNGVDAGGMTGPGGGECFASVDTSYNAHAGTTVSRVFLDAPGVAGPVEYKVQCRTGGGAHPLWINRARNNNNGPNYGSVCASTLLLMEVKL